MEQSSREKPGVLYTFYSYKGGVGRSMALANVAALLATRWKQKVLIVDWDLEAPGIERFFDGRVMTSREKTPGLVDLIVSITSPKPVDWRDCLMTVSLDDGGELSIISAGLDDGEYIARLRSISWDALFEQRQFGLQLERLRNEWLREYNFVLVDSRTGVTDIGGICTIHLPDVLVSFFTTNLQSLDGVKNIMRRARQGHKRLPLDRNRLLVVPVPSRDESNSEYELARTWRKRFAEELAEFYADWIPEGEAPVRVLDRLKIPYFAYWSFGERLAVLEEDPENPKTLAGSYNLLARLLVSKLNWGVVKDDVRPLMKSGADDPSGEATEFEQRYALFVEHRFQPNLQRYQKLAETSRRWQRRVGTTGLAIAALLLPSIPLSVRFDQDILTASLMLAGLLTAVTAPVLIWYYSRRRRHWAGVAYRLGREKMLAEAGAGSYRGQERADALLTFQERVESIIGEEFGELPASN